MVRRQVDAVRRMDHALHDSTAFVIVEANLGLVAETVARHLHGLPKMEFLWTAAAVGGRIPVSANDEGAIRAGFFTLNHHKHAMMHSIKQYMQGRRIWWHKNLVAYATKDTEHELALLQHADGGEAELRMRYCPHAHTREEIFEAEARLRMMQLLVTQLGNMSMIRHQPAGTRPAYLDNSKIIVTGKLTSQHKDDCALALGIGLMGVTMDVRGRATALAHAAMPATRLLGR
jgi:hypothetical protein